MTADPRLMPPDALHAALSALPGLRPPERQDWTGWRVALEALPLSQDLDRWLLAVRELELLGDGLPLELAGLRRGVVMEQDAVTMTCEAWSADGERHAVRLLRPSWQRDPVWRRRLERSVPVLPPTLLGPGLFEEDQALACRLTPLPGPSLAALLPAEDLPDPTVLASFLVGGLMGLADLHARGLVHGRLGPQHLVQAPDGVKLLWLDPVLNRPCTPQDDLAALGQAVSQLDPDRCDPVGSLARSLASAPPPSAEFAKSLLRRVMVEVLVDRRHRMALRSRGQLRRQNEARLLHAVHRLEHAVRPPIGTFCLRAGLDPVLVVAESDGERVRGGPVGGLPARFLPQAWSREHGLNAAASRALLRAWATRTKGDERRRLQVQSELNSSDADAALLCRWLSAQARLRALRMILELGN